MKLPVATEKPWLYSAASMGGVWDDKPWRIRGKET
jgi:hypothetical protein